MVHIYCGDGKGKTTAAIGLSVRAAGAGKKVLFTQFFKDGNSSEINVLNSIENITCFFAKKDFGWFSQMSDDEKSQTQIGYTELINEALSQKYDMVVLDESVSAYNHLMIKHELLLSLIEKRGKDCEIILTGRNPPKELLNLADYVSSIDKIKHPYDKGIMARIGIEM